MPSTPRCIISSKNCRILRGEAPSNSVVLVVTRKPRSSAALMPTTASSNTPSRQTASSWSSRSPSMWTLNVRYLEGEKRDSFSLSKMALVQVDVFLPLDELDHQLVDVGVHQRLAPGDAHDGSAALLHGLDALLDRQVLLEDLRGVLDLAAAGAGEVASEKRLEHEDQGVPLPAAELLLDHVARDRIHLGHRYAHLLKHPSCLWWRWPPGLPPFCGEPPSLGLSTAPAADRVPELQPHARGFPLPEASTPQSGPS